MGLLKCINGRIIENICNSKNIHLKKAPFEFVEQKWLETSLLVDDSWTLGMED